jgi:hypothetical protein
MKSDDDSNEFDAVQAMPAENESPTTKKNFGMLNRPNALFFCVI